MKISIKNLLPNPFRNINEYPIKADKVNGLVASIKQTSFWDNILVRPSPDKKDYFEIAYGHHRLKALQKVYAKDLQHKVDIPVRDLDDETMLKVMANENSTDWGMDTAVAMETVKATEKYFQTFGDRSPKYGDGPLKERIARFLGGSYNVGLVQDMLAIIHAVEKKEVDNKAVKTIPEPSKAATFVSAIKSLPEEKKLPVEKQRELAERIVDPENTIPRAEIKHRVEWAAGIYTPADKLRKKEVPDIRRFIWEHRAEVDRLTKYLDALADERDSIPERSREWQSFRAACALLLTALNRLFGDDAVEGGKTHGKKEKRRAVKQGPARALLSRQ